MSTRRQRRAALGIPPARRPWRVILWRPVRLEPIVPGERPAYLGLQVGVTRGGHGWAIRLGRNPRPLLLERYDGQFGPRRYFPLLGGRLTAVRITPRTTHSDERNPS